MAQITGIGFSNFRVFKEDTFFNLAPITIFTGANNSGKSSIFKGLLLLKDNAWRNKLSKIEFFSGSHKLGTFSLAKTNASEKDEIDFITRIKVDEHNFFISEHLFFYSLNRNFRTDEIAYITSLEISKGNEIKEDWIIDDFLVTAFSDKNGYTVFVNIKHFLARLHEALKIFKPIEDKIKFQGNSTTFPDFKIYYSGIVGVASSLKKVVDYNCEIINDEELKKILGSYPSGTIVSIKQYLEEKIIGLSSYSFFDSQQIFDEGELEFDLFKAINWHQNSYKRSRVGSACSIEEINVKGLLGEDYEELSTLFEDVKLFKIVQPEFFVFLDEIVWPQIEKLKSSLSEQNSKSDYIEAIRANTQRLYSNQSQGTGFNDLLIEAGSKGVAAERDFISKLQEFLNKWVDKFSFGESLIISRIKGIATEVSLMRKGRKVDLVDLGYGATQFIALLIKISTLEFRFGLHPHDDRYHNAGKILATNGPILMIEEPEANLHPKLQSLLADFFIDVVQNFEVTLLIETHSEYLIRRLQVLTAGGELKTENTQIYYLNSPSDSGEVLQQIVKININTDGTLTNDFGSGFIDEATNWKLELMRLKNAHLTNVN